MKTITLWNVTLENAEKFKQILKSELLDKIEANDFEEAAHIIYRIKEVENSIAEAKEVEE